MWVKWKYILENKKEGDTIVIYKLSNALGALVELPIFLKLCIANRIRLISLGDHIDTDGTLFQSSSYDFMKTLALFGSETYACQQHYTRDFPPDITGTTRRLQLKGKRLLLEKSILNAYQSEMTVEAIAETMNIAISSIYSILHKYGMKTNRCTGRIREKKKCSKPRQYTLKK